MDKYAFYVECIKKIADNQGLPFCDYQYLSSDIEILENYIKCEFYLGNIDITLKYRLLYFIEEYVLTEYLKERKEDLL